MLSQDFHKKCRAVQYADERNRAQKSRDCELLIGRVAGFLRADWPSRLSPVFAENRMWKFQRKKRNSALTSGKHLSVMCVTQGGGRSAFQCALQRVGTRPRNDWHWPFMNKSSLWGKALTEMNNCPASFTGGVLSASLTLTQPAPWKYTGFREAMIKVESFIPRRL